MGLYYCELLLRKCFCAARVVCARAHLAYAHEHSIIHYPAACDCMLHRVPVPHAYPRQRGARMRARRPARHSAQARHAARARRAAPERDFRACQASHRVRRPGALGAAGSVAVVSAPKRPCQPWSSGCPLVRQLRPPADLSVANHDFERFSSRSGAGGLRAEHHSLGHGGSNFVIRSRVQALLTLPV